MLLILNVFFPNKVIRFCFPIFAFLKLRSFFFPNKLNYIKKYELKKENKF